MVTYDTPDRPVNGASCQTIDAQSSNFGAETIGEENPVGTGRPVNDASRLFTGAQTPTYDAH